MVSGTPNKMDVCTVERLMEVRGWEEGARGRGSGGMEKRQLVVVIGCGVLKNCLF